MHDLDKLLVRFRVGSSGQRYIAIEGSKEGHGNLWFTFDFEDFERLHNDYGGAATDIGYTTRKISADHWLFFEMPIPKFLGTPIRIEAKVWQLFLPVQVSGALIRYARMIYARQIAAKTDDSHVLELPMARRARWAHLYGQGSGSIEVEVNDRVKPLVEASFADGGEHGSLSSALERLKVITRNGTRNLWDTGKLVLQPDGRGLYFTIYSPTGRPTMHGGVFNHGSESEPDWSIHT